MQDWWAQNFVQDACSISTLHVGPDQPDPRPNPNPNPLRGRLEVGRGSHPTPLRVLAAFLQKKRLAAEKPGSIKKTHILHLSFVPTSPALWASHHSSSRCYTYSVRLLL